MLKHFCIFAFEHKSDLNRFCHVIPSLNIVVVLVYNIGNYIKDCVEDKVGRSAYLQYL